MIGPLRYVVLRHEGIPDPHFDIMLEKEDGSALETWRSNYWPVTQSTPLTKIGDHRLEYLDYEGALSGDRGFVKRIETGMYKAHPQWDDPYVCDVWFNEPVTHHLWLLIPPGHEWAF